MLVAYVCGFVDLQVLLINRPYTEEELACISATEPNYYLSSSLAHQSFGSVYPTQIGEQSTCPTHSLLR